MHLITIPSNRLQQELQNGFDYNQRYNMPHLQQWLKIDDRYIRDITNSPNFNQLIALGKSWKHSLLEELNKRKFNSREGMCWIDYLEQKLCGQFNTCIITEAIIGNNW